jgi:hypothetical protein
MVGSTGCQEQKEAWEEGRAVESKTELFCLGQCRGEIRQCGGPQHVDMAQSEEGMWG